MFRDLTERQEQQLADLVSPRSRVFTTERFSSFRDVTVALKGYADITLVESLLPHDKQPDAKTLMGWKINDLTAAASWLGFAAITRKVRVDGVTFYVLVAAITEDAANQAIDAVADTIREVLEDAGTLAGV